MAMWLRAYTRKKRAGSRLNLTPTPGLGSPARVDALPGPGPRRAARGEAWHGRAKGKRAKGLLMGETAGKGPREAAGQGAAPFALKRGACGPKGTGHAQGLPDIPEKAEQSCQAGGGGGSGQLSAQLKVVGKKSLQEVSTSEEIDDATTGLWSESETDGLQVNSSLSNSDLVSGLSLQHLISNSLLDCSTMDSSKESLSSFSSPEVFRGSDYFDRSCPKLEEYMLCKNSTLLDTSKAVAVEKVSLFSNLSSIIGTSSEDYQKCHRKIVMTLTDQDISSKLKSTSNPESGRNIEIEMSDNVENAACEILLAEKPCTLIPEKMKKKPEKCSEERNSKSQIKLSSQHLKLKAQSPHQRSVPENNRDGSVTKFVLSQPLETALNLNSRTSDKKRKGLLTSTPSSQTVDLVIDFSSIQRSSFEELFPNVSNYVNSNEIVPVSGLQETSSNEVSSDASELCCIVRASLGNRQVKSKTYIKKKKYSPSKDITQDIIIKANHKM